MKSIGIGASCCDAPLRVWSANPAEAPRRLAPKGISISSERENVCSPCFETSTSSQKQHSQIKNREWKTNKSRAGWLVDKLQSDSAAQDSTRLSVYVSSQHFNVGLTSSAVISLVQWVCNYKLNYKPASAPLVHFRANAPLPSNANTRGCQKAATRERRNRRVTCANLFFMIAFAWARGGNHKNAKVRHLKRPEKSFLQQGKKHSFLCCTGISIGSHFANENWHPSWMRAVHKIITHRYYLSQVIWMVIF